jgi:DNA-binding NarL/FixJ family response regulator
MRNLNVFVVEDSPVIRENLVEALEDLAPVSVVGHAESAADAVAWLRSPPRPCDLAIVDIFLCDGSGLDVLRALQRADSPLRRVVLTNYATPEVSRQCLALGAEQVFDKSRDIDGLVAYCTARAASGGSGP